MSTNKGMILFFTVLCLCGDAAAETFRYVPPAGTAAINGEVTKGTIRDVWVKDDAKQVSVNGNLFMIHDLTADQIDGGIIFDFETTSRYEVEVKMTGATGTAQPLPDLYLYEKKSTYRGVVTETRKRK